MIKSWKARRLAVLGALIVAAVNLIHVSGASAAPPGTIALSQHQWVTARGFVVNDGTHFGGVSADALTRSAGIYRVSSRATDAATHAAIANVVRAAALDDGTPKRWNLSIVDVRYSFDELTATKAQITTLQPWAKDSLPYLVTWYVDAVANAVHVGVTQITPTLIQDAQVFGDKVKLVVESQPSPSTRTNDSPPWWGGDVISGGGAQCTSGFSVSQRNNGHQGVFTAGHCFGVGVGVYQGSSFMGFVTTHGYGGYGYDYDFIDTSASSGGSGPVVYSGGLNDWTTLNVTLVLNALPGDAICTDGSVTLQNCSGNVDESNLCFNYSGNVSCGLDTAYSTNGTWLVQHGDSGGPVYWGNGSGNITAVGIIAAEAGTGQGSTRVYFTDIYTDLNGSFRMTCSGGCS